MVTRRRNVAKAVDATSSEGFSSMIMVGKDIRPVKASFPEYLTVLGRTVFGRLDLIRGIHGTTAC